MRLREICKWIRQGRAPYEADEVGPDGQPRNDAQRRAIEGLIERQRAEKRRAVIANSDAFDELEAIFRARAAR